MMKENCAFMASKELKEFFKLIEEQYGKVPQVFSKLVFIRGKERIHAITRDVEKLDLQNLNINSMGVYIAELKNGQLRLSIEGAQLVGPSATKNVCELNYEQLREWFKGNDVAVNGAYEGFAILKNGTDYVGSGKYKEGVILNFVPKARRLLEVH